MGFNYTTLYEVYDAKTNKLVYYSVSAVYLSSLLNCGAREIFNASRTDKPFHGYLIKKVGSSSVDYEGLALEWDLFCEFFNKRISWVGITDKTQSYKAIIHTPNGFRAVPHGINYGD